MISVFLKWLKEHKICPVCKFYLVKKGSLRKSSLDLIIDDSIKEKEKIEKFFPYKTSDNNSDCNMDELNASDDISKLINEENNKSEKKLEIWIFLLMKNKVYFLLLRFFFIIYV